MFETKKEDSDLKIIDFGLSKIIKCKVDWCKVEVDKYKGWVKQTALWGRL